MPHLEQELWQPLKDSGLTVLIVGREHSLAEVAEYKSALNLTMPALADPERSIYSMYAKKSIPRTFVIDGDGRVVLSELGFSPEKFEQLKMVVAQLLGAKGSTANSSPSSPVAVPAPSGSVLAKNVPPMNGIGRAPNILATTTKTMPVAPTVSVPHEPGELAIRSALYSIGKQQYDSAIADLETFLTKWPQHAQAHYLLAICYSFKKNYERAADEYRSAIKFATDSRLRSLSEMGLRKIGR